MILHGFAWRNSKNTVLRPKTLKLDPKSQKYPKNLKNYMKIQVFTSPGVAYLIPSTVCVNKHWSRLAFLWIAAGFLLRVLMNSNNCLCAVNGRSAAGAKH